MSIRTSIAIAAALVAGIAAVTATLLFRRSQPIVLDGAVLLASAQLEEQAPIAGVRVMVRVRAASSATTSDATGFFSLALPAGVHSGDRVTVHFEHPDYRPQDLTVIAGRTLPVARMTPVFLPPPPIGGRRPTVISNVRVRYSISEPNIENVGTGVKMFETPNRGNVPCDGHEPCSPDGKWKAGIGGASLDAGPQNRFRNARVSCIAGPCPFTKIDADNFSAGGRRISVTVRDWSDTATFVLQAEVVRVEMGDVVRYVYPVILDRTMNFTLPASAEGPSIEADVNGTPIVFPLGPRLLLSWATCDARTDKNQAKVYRCALKPAFSFQ